MEMLCTSTHAIVMSEGAGEGQYGEGEESSCNLQKRSQAKV
jgi:hypothetical protein